ncbi:hypothetical protein L2E82_45062 [Cichorium intybus]|uniref:Uncharacterized protein n=1 Tax=Cichorium intybus TaxID=13427 RepID=A0ACB8ZSY0_CICIN|nr:hypothetical protein L2E82_45062 [Cichorium intybus]
MNHTQSFNLVDPFEEQCILSLNPQTFGVSKDALKSIDLESIHQHMKSMPSTILEPILEVKQLQSPEEFFAAFEKFENTQKELKRQRGGKEVDEIKELNSYQSTLENKRVELFDMGAGVSEPMADDNAQVASGEKCRIRSFSKLGSVSPQSNYRTPVFFDFLLIFGSMRNSVIIFIANSVDATTIHRQLQRRLTSNKKGKEEELRVTTKKKRLIDNSEA